MPKIDLIKRMAPLYSIFTGPALSQRVWVCGAAAPQPHTV